MLYTFLKIWVRVGLWFYCRRICFDVHPQKGPVILACNHPNSFFDALIIGSHYKQPVHFLARGDVFEKPFVTHLLRGMNMIPIHRLSEGREGLKQNEQTFQECLEVLKAEGTVLIFSEGICRNEWGLRSLKKGTARLAYVACHNNGLPDLIIKPMAFSYSSFTALPLSVEVAETSNFRCEDVGSHQPAAFYLRFNEILQQNLQAGLRTQQEMNGKRKSDTVRKIMLGLPASVGWVVHKPLYNGLKKFAARKTEGTVFYHSVLFGLLLIVYPVLLLVLTSIVVSITQQVFFWLLLPLLPFTAWCYKEYKAD